MEVFSLTNTVLYPTPRPNDNCERKHIWTQALPSESFIIWVHQGKKVNNLSIWTDMMFDVCLVLIISMV